MVGELRHRLDVIRRSVGADTAFRALAILIVFIAFVARAYRLGANGLGSDEAFSVQAGSWGLLTILQIVSTGEPHPPLYYWFLGMWDSALGLGEYSIRFPTLVANVLTVAFLIKTCELLGWRSAGLVAALLFALNPYQVFYAQEARMYTPVAFFGLAALFFALKVQAEGKAVHLGLYILFSLLALYTHYYAIFLLLFINLLVLAAALVGGVSTWRQAARWLIAQLVVAALYLPWLAFVRTIVTSYVPPRQGVSLQDVFRDALLRFSLGGLVPDDQGFALALGFVAIGAFGLLYAARVKGKWPAWYRACFVLGYSFTPLALGFAVSLARPMLQTRYLMVSAPAFSLALGLGVVGLYRLNRLLGIGSGLFLVSAQVFAVGNLYFDPKYAKTDYPVSTAYVERHASPGDAILLNGWGQASQFWYYYLLRAKNPLPDHMLPLDKSEDWPKSLAKLDEVMSRHRGVWLLDYDVGNYDPSRVIERHLAESYYQAFAQRIGGTYRMRYYASGSAPLAEAKSLGLECGNDVLVTSYLRTASSARPGDILPMALRWKALRQPAKDYGASWRLLDSAGHTVWQRDSQPASGFSPTRGWTEGQEVLDRYALPIPAYLTPGQYHLVAVVYDQASGHACQPPRGSEAILPGAVDLDRIEVLDVKPEPGLQEPPFSESGLTSYGGLRLLGIDSEAGPYRSGDRLTVGVWWRVDESPTRDYEASLRLLGSQGSYLLAEKLRLGPESYPTSRWMVGRSVLTHLDATIPARVVSGSYRLSFTITGGEQGEANVTGSRAVSVASRDRKYQVPSISHPKTADFGGLVSLLGYDLQPDPGKPLPAGQDLRLTLYWRAQQETAVSYKVFVHVVGEDGQIYGQADSFPLGGNAPTDGWTTGEVLTDGYSLTIKPGAPPGKYTLIVGFYEPEKGTRIPLADGSGDSFILGQLDFTGEQ